MNLIADVGTHEPTITITQAIDGLFAIPETTGPFISQCDIQCTLRIASSLSGAVPSVAMLEQAAATLVEDAKTPVDELADLLCRKPLSDAQITRKAILTFSHID